MPRHRHPLRQLLLCALPLSMLSEACSDDGHSPTGSGASSGGGSDAGGAMAAGGAAAGGGGHAAGGGDVSGGGGTGAEGPGPTPGADRVLVVYNLDWPVDEDADGAQDSEETANYYLARRGVPAEHALGVHGGGTDLSAMAYDSFQTNLAGPIRDKLSALGPESIDYILFAYGLPAAVFDPTNNPVSIDNVLMALEYFVAGANTIAWTPNPYMDPAPGFTPIKSPFSHDEKLDGTNIYLITRLDGPRGLNGALDLVDQARYGDRYLAVQDGHYQGNVYVDSRFGNGAAPYTDDFLAADFDVQAGNYFSYESADKNIAFAEHYVEASGLSLRWENTPNAVNIGTSGAVYSDGEDGTSAPRALFYGGWYNYNNYNDVWEWLPGSVACDLSSDSLYYWQLRNPSPTNFGSNALLHGASAVSGVVGEPYVNGHPRPNILIYYLLAGYNLAEASALATPTVGWMPMTVGDPLYAPFRDKPAVLDTQVPVFSTGYPSVDATTASAVVRVLVDDQPEPEVVKVTIEYGTDTSYGSVAASGQGFFRHHAISVGGLSSGVTYHYRATVEDPAGNVASSDDATFVAP